MISDTDLIVIDDDDEDHHHLEVVENDKNSESTTESTQVGSKKPFYPKKIGGFTKPSPSYPMLIAHALSVCPSHQATALNICNIIAEIHPYFKLCPLNWRQSVYAALTRRKKCFVIVDTNQDGEYVWSYNPLFEKYMLENWVPKYLTKGSDKPVQQRQSSEAGNIFSSSNNMAGGSESNVQLESIVEDPRLFVECITSDNPTQAPSAQMMERDMFFTEENTGTRGELPTDFLPGNACFSKISLSLEEAKYRQDFKKAHPKVEKFRLHCTVCDTHLGTSGKVAEKNVRFHSRLSVLTCAPCYAKTLHSFWPPGTKGVCYWCNEKYFKTAVNCHFCSTNFCETCIKHNFGEIWLKRVSNTVNWKCFLCNMKQIWPHRAIAYSLYIEYSDLRKMRNSAYVLSTGRLLDESFFSTDKSVCCKNESGNSMTRNTPNPEHNIGGATSESLVPISEITNLTDPLYSGKAIKSHSIMLKNQSPNHFIIQTPEAGASVTLNTGTQYIHNIYPEKQIMYVQPSTAIQETYISQKLPPAHQVVTNLEIPNKKLVAERSKNDLDPVAPQHTTFCNVADETSTLCLGQEDNEPPFHSSVDPFSEECTEDPLDPSPKPFTCVTLVTAKCEEEFIIPQNELKEKDLSYSELSTSTKEIALNKVRKIRPMPKSKKESLLKSLSEGVCRIPSPNTNEIIVPYCNQSNICMSANGSIHSDSQHSQTSETSQNLRNIMQNMYDENRVNVNHLKTINLDSTAQSGSSLDGENMVLNDTTGSSNTNVPKIKVKTLHELQDNIESLPEMNNKNISIETDESQEYDQIKIPNEEVDVTVLKQGIIEASRTLVTTQKKFKELAKTISSQVVYKPKTARGMIKKFQDILKTCRTQIEEVDKNVSKKYNYLKSMDLDSMLRSIRENEKKESKSSKANRTTNCSNEPSQVFYTHNNGVIDVIASSSQTCLTKKRKSVCLDPLSKKTILETPGITNEDIERVNSPEILSTPVKNNTDNLYIKDLKSRQLQLRKKKEIWSYKKQGRWYHKKSSSKPNYKYGKLQKKQTKFDHNENTDTGYSVQDQIEQTTDYRYSRKNFKLPCTPSRISQRNHASTACQGITATSRLPINISMCEIIKPCSVTLHKLDPRIVQLLEMRVKEL